MLANPIDQIAHKLAAALEQQRVLFTAVQRNIELQQAIQRTIDLERSVQQQIFGPVLEVMRALPERTRTALKALGARGWYDDLRKPLPEVWTLSAALESSEVEEAEATLAAYYRAELDRIEQDLCAWFPNRARIISRALGAHRRDEYELSVPVLLAQADGICKELIQLQFFGRRDGRPQTATYVQGFAADSFEAALLHPLEEPLPISDSVAGPEEAERALNRHGVLHGLSLSYGTEINSLKAVSLLYYLASVLRPEPDGSPAGL
jgi:hypothetical protein